MLTVQKKDIPKILENSLKIEKGEVFNLEEIKTYSEEIQKSQAPAFVKNKYTGEIFCIFSPYDESEEMYLSQIEFKSYIDLFEEEKVIMYANICGEKLFIGTFENLVPFFSFIETVETVENIKEQFATFMYFFEGEIEIDWKYYEKISETPQKKLEVYKNKVYSKYIIVVNDEEEKVYLEAVMIENKLTVFWDYAGMTNKQIEIGEISNLTDEMAEKFLGVIDEIEGVEEDRDTEQGMV